MGEKWKNLDGAVKIKNREMKKEVTGERNVANKILSFPKAQIRNSRNRKQREARKMSLELFAIICVGCFYAELDHLPEPKYLGLDL